MLSNKKHEMQQALAWDLRCLRSGFGKQCKHVNRTEPVTPFGSSARDNYHKVRGIHLVESLAGSLAVAACLSDLFLVAAIPLCRAGKGMPRQQLSRSSLQDICTHSPCCDALIYLR